MMAPGTPTLLLSGVIGDGFGDVECRGFPTHVVGAHFAFGDDARDSGFETLGPLNVSSFRLLRV